MLLMAQYPIHAAAAYISKFLSVENLQVCCLTNHTYLLWNSEAYCDTALSNEELPLPEKTISSLTLLRRLDFYLKKIWSR